MKSAAPERFTGSWMFCCSGGLAIEVSASPLQPTVPLSVP